MFGIFKSNQKLADEVAKTEQVLTQKLHTGLDQKVENAMSLFRQAQQEVNEIIQQKQENVEMIDAHIANLEAYEAESNTEITELGNFTANIDKIFKTKL